MAASDFWFVSTYFISAPFYLFYFPKYRPISMLIVICNLLVKLVFKSVKTTQVS